MTSSGPIYTGFPGDVAATPFPGPVYPSPCGKFRIPAEGPLVGEDEETGTGLP